MIYLDRPLRKCEIVLAGAVTTNQWDITAHFFDQIPQSTTTLQRGGVQKSNSNNTTDVSIVDAVGQQGIVRNIRLITMHNKDTASSTITVKIDDSGSETILIKQTIAAGESLVYEDGRGFEVLSPITAPFVDTTPLVRGSLDATKLLRIEVDGLTTGTTRTWTALDADIVVAGSSSALTSGRVAYVTTGGLLTTDADLLFDGTTLTANTVDINGGAVDGTVIGGASAAAITGTTITANTSLTVHSVTSTGATGTGNIVFSASPTFTGTITAAAANFSGAVSTGTFAATRTGVGDVATFTTTAGSSRVGYFYADTQYVAFSSGAALLNNSYVIDVTNGTLIHKAGGNLVTTTSSTGVAITGTLSTTDIATVGNGTTGYLKINSGNTVLPALSNGDGIYQGRSAYGALIAGKGSSYDFYLINGAGSTVMEVPTGTVNVAFYGNVTLGDAAGDSHAINGNASLLAGKSITYVGAPTTAFVTPEDNSVGAAISGSAAGRLLVNGTTEVARWTSTGLGVFCTPGVAFEVNKSSAGSTLFGLFNNADNTNAASHCAVFIGVGGSSGGDPLIRFSVSGVGEWALGQDNSDSDKFKLSRGNALGTNDYLTIDTNGNVSMGATTLTGALTYGGVTLSNSVTGTGSMVLSASPTISGTITASGGQIAFPATQSASADANTLDDYEEGTWTPGLSFGGGTTGITYAGQSGHYTKIGNKVTAWFYIELSNKGSSTGAALLTGLPFTIANVNSQYGAGGGLSYWANLTATVVYLGVRGVINSTTATFTGATAATDTLAEASDAAFANDTMINGCITYRV